MLDGEVVLPIVGQALVERSVLLLGDLRGVARPDGLRLVELLVLDGLLLDLLGLLLLVLLVVDLLDLGLLLVLLLGGLLLVLNLLKAQSENAEDTRARAISPSRPPWSQRVGWGRK